MEDKYLEKVRNILATINYATLATVTPEGKPWNSPVAHELDSDLNIYWASDKENQHSINIQSNPKAFIVIYDSRAPAGTGEGVYIEADVLALSDVTEIHSITNQKGKQVFSNDDDYLGESNRRSYKAIPKRIWINDAEEKDGQFIRDYRVEIPIDKI